MRRAAVLAAAAALVYLCRPPSWLVAGGLLALAVIYAVYARLQRRQTLTTLKRARLLDRMFNGSQDIYGLTPVGARRFHWANDGWERVLGWTAAEIEAMPDYTELVHPDDLPDTRRTQTEKVENGEDAAGYENRYRCKEPGPEGEPQYRVIRWDGRVDETTGWIYAIGRDVTDLKRIEQEREQAHRMLAVSPQLMCVSNGVDRFVWANAAMHSFVGPEMSKKLYEIDSWSFVHPDDLGVKTEIFQTINCDRVLLSYTNRWRNAEGQWCDIEWLVQRAEDGRDYCTGRDVTDRRAYERRLQQQTREMTEFAYAAAHDLKAPLSRIGRLSDSARSAAGRGDNALLNRRLEQIGEVGRAGAAIVEAALDYARTGGVVETRRQPVEPAIEDAVKAADIRARPALVENGPSDLVARFHKASLVSILTNLLDNAKKHGQETVTLRWSEWDNHGGVCIEVVDDGPGFKPEWASKLFEPAWRGRADVEGHGFGLAKARRLAEAMGAEIYAHSDGEGCGALFGVLLPP